VDIERQASMASAESTNSKIDHFKVNLQQIKEVQAAVDERWGSKFRKRMQDQRKSLQNQNKILLNQISSELSNSIEKRSDERRRRKLEDYDITEEAESSEKMRLLEVNVDSWRSELEAAIKLETEYMTKLTDQLMRLLKSVHVVKTREEIGELSISQILNFMSGGGVEEERTEVEQRLQELNGLKDYRTSLYVAELTQIEDKEDDLDLPQIEEQSFLDKANKTFEEIQTTFTSNFSKHIGVHLMGRQYKLVLGILATTIVGLLILILYGIVNAALKPNSILASGDDLAYETTTEPCIEHSPSDVC